MLWLVLGAAMLAGQAAPDLRFHHVHIALADPAAAMTEAAARLGGQRLILQGHGPAVRTREGYLVFDRPDGLISDLGEGKAASPRDGAAPAVFEAALRWARTNGLTINPPDEHTRRLASEITQGRVVVVAFSSDDPQVAIERLHANGIEPFSRTDETARYRVAPDVMVEIISETDRPDTHWCPMHPAVRAPGASRCPICSMEMVPIPPPRVGEYALDVAVGGGGRNGEPVTLRLTVGAPQNGTVVSSFLEVHERPFHLFMVSRDLTTFVHAHPEQQEGGTFVLEQTLEPGEYMLVADFLPAGGTPQVVHRAIVTPGYSGPLFQDPPRLAVTPVEQIIDGLRIRFVAGEVTALRAASLRFVVSEVATGAEVRDLEPYLGASGHLLIVNAALTSALHGHPAGTQTAGPEILFDPVLPKPGLYKLWLQFQRKGRIVTVPFVIEVAPL